MNRILIVQFALGPTHKARLLHNLKTCTSYKYFDVFVMTDDIDYFSSVLLMPNLTIKDLDELRKDYPWSIELEKIPPTINDEAEYAKYFIENNVKIPTLLRRFVFLWENVTNYLGFIFMDCDVLPVVNDEWYQKLENYFYNPIISHPYPEFTDSLENKIITTPAGGPYDQENCKYLHDFAINFNNDYKITDKEIINYFTVTDGNFRTLRFPNKEMIKPFFELLNNIIYDILTLKKEEYFIIQTHSMWNLQSEQILSMIFNLLDVKCFPWTEDFGFSRNESFNINSYPEDRFWNWGMNMEPSMIGKQDFINKNYNKLKKYYEDHFIEFPY